MNPIYAGILNRIKAAFIDSVILMGGMYAVAEILALFNEVPNWVRIICFMALFVLYEPFFVSRFGGSIGHSFCKISIRKENKLTQYIPFHFALLRFIVKFLLGWISLLTIGSNSKNKAIHDFVSNSVAIEVAEN